MFAAADGRSAAELGAVLLPRIPLDVEPRSTVVSASVSSSGAGVSVAAVVASPIDQKWFATGGASGPLGNPVGPEKTAPASGWTYRLFKRGAIYSHPTIGTFATSESLAHWNKKSREAGHTGLLRGDAKVTADGLGRYASSSNGVLYFRADMGVIERASSAAFALTPAEQKVFSSKYVQLRQRYFDFFWYNGLSAKELQVSPTDGKAVVSNDTIRSVEITDQGLHMGQAMLAFAGEAQLLRAKGLPATSSEAAIRGLLEAFDRMDAAAQQVYGSDVPGFFVRDDAKPSDVPWTLKSDFTATKPSDAAMSLDQVTSLMVGWWAIAKYSGNPQSVALAKTQMQRVMDFLSASQFVIRMPTDGSPAARGADIRFAAGFFCTLADKVLGTSYLEKSKVDITLEGAPLRFRDDNLGEFTIPGYTIPASMPVKLSHEAVLSMTTAGIAALSAPLSIRVKITDLFPNMPQAVTLPCAHLTPAHPGGHKNTVPCVHVTVAHRDGDKIPCTHITVQHPQGHDLWLPCLHIGKQHDHDTITKTISIGGFKRKISVDVPCVHIGPVHPGGHTNHVPCTHMTTLHPDGDTVPCVHPAPLHPEGDTVTLPCLHLEPAHKGGHEFDTGKLSVDIPLGSMIPVYSRHIVLQALAFDARVPVLNMIPAAFQSNHVWSLLLRAQIVGDVPDLLIAGIAKASLASLQSDALPSNLLDNEWCRPNRWEKCTELQNRRDTGGPFAYNGLDYLSLEVLSKLNSSL